MPEPTPSQLKIDGILMVPEGFTTYEISNLWTWLDSILVEHNYKFDGTISPLNPDAESFMVEVERKRLEQLKQFEVNYFNLINDYRDESLKNDKAYSDLAEQLRVTQRSLDMHKHSLEETQKESREQIFNLTQENKALELRLKVKDSPIKAGLKRIWKWFKGLVGK